MSNNTAIPNNQVTKPAPPWVWPLILAWGTGILTAVTVQRFHSDHWGAVVACIAITALLGGQAYTEAKKAHATKTNDSLPNG